MNPLGLDLEPFDQILAGIARDGDDPVDRLQQPAQALGPGHRHFKAQAGLLKQLGVNQRNQVVDGADLGHGQRMKNVVEAEVQIGPEGFDLLPEQGPIQRRLGAEARHHQPGGGAALKQRGDAKSGEEGTEAVVQAMCQE